MKEKQILEKIRKMRQNQGVTLKDLSLRAKLTEGYLSRIENSESAPPISTLYRIAESLNLDINYLFMNGDVASDNRNIAVIRKKDIDEEIGQSPILEGSYGYAYIPLGKEKLGKNMDPYFLIEDFKFGQASQHEGEEFYFVIEGCVEFFYGVEKYFLEKGDSVYFDANIPHKARSFGESKAKVLVLIHSYRRMHRKSIP